MSLTLTKNDVINIMNEMQDFWSLSFENQNLEKNLTIWVFHRTPSDSDQKLRFPVPFYSCEICSNGDFRFIYSSETSIVRVLTPFCGPVTNHEHFMRIQAVFEREASILHKYRK